jgi:SAM-dependent methyltransferase
MSTNNDDQDMKALQDSLQSDSRLLPEKFQAYFEKYLNRDMGRCKTTLSFMPATAADAPLKVLEVGSFPGVMSIVIKKSGYDLDCVDLNPERMQGLAEAHELRLEKCDIEVENLPYPDNTHDVVIFTEVLEHLRVNPLHALKELKRVLKPGGTLVLTVPNISPAHRLKFLFGVDYQGDPVHEFGKLEQLGHMGHIRVYSEAEVRGMVEHAGFKVAQVKPEGRLNLPSAGMHFVLKAIGLAASLHPKAKFSVAPEAFYSHLYVTAIA